MRNSVSRVIGFWLFSVVIVFTSDLSAWFGISDAGSWGAFGRGLSGQDRGRGVLGHNYVMSFTSECLVQDKDWLRVGLSPGLLGHHRVVKFTSGLDM